MDWKKIGFLLLMIISLLACRFSSNTGSTADPGSSGVPLPPDEDFGVLCFVEFADGIVASAPVFEEFFSRDGGLTWQQEGVEIPGISGSDCAPNKILQKELWASLDGLIRYRFDPGKSIEKSTDGGGRWVQVYDLAYVQWEPVSENEPGRTVVVQPGPLDAMIDPSSGNVLLAMGHAGVLLGLPTGEWRWVAVGAYANAEMSSQPEEISQEESISRSVTLIPPDLEINTENNYVNALAFSPDGSQLAASGFDGGVKLFGFPKGDFQFWQQWGEDTRFRKLYGAVFSFDGKTLITCGTNVDQSLRFWDVDSWELIKEFQGFQSSALDAGVYDDDQFFAIAFGKDPNNKDQVKIYRLPESVELATFNSPLGSITSLLFIPETRYLAIGSGSGSVEIWDFVDGEQIFSFQIDSTPAAQKSMGLRVLALGFDPSENALLALRGDGRLSAFDLSTGEVVWQRALSTPHGWYMNTAVFSEDGRLIAVGMHNGPMALFDSRSGEVLTRQWIYDAGTLMQLAFSPDDSWLSAGFSNGHIKVWEISQLIQ